MVELVREARIAAAAARPGLARVQRARPEAEPRRDRTAFSPVAFLSAQGVAPGLLLEAEAEAARLGVGADAALLASGAIEEDAFYRALARHLRVPFLEAPRLAPETPLAAIAAGVARLADATPDGRPIYAMAPRGPRIVALARLLRGPRGTGGEVAIVAPSALSAATQSIRATDIAAAARATTPAALSASGGVSLRQKLALAAMTAVCLATLAPIGAVGDVATILVGLVFLWALAVRLGAVLATMLESGASPAPALADAELPRASVVVALYREAAAARDLIEALEALDYPRARLEAKLVVVEDDTATRAVLAALAPPAWCEVVVAPPGAPRTKPRALNVALPLLTGDFVAVYDAEDRPDPDQLRKAAARFAIAPAAVACLQAKLAIDNQADGPLAKLFAVEYAGLFEALNPGLAALGLPIPLGGTSNHFRVGALRRVGGWDAWNVTEDADLGLRLARCGYRVETLDSTTWEEAPFTPRAWLRQRGRWLKGWMQTAMVHGRAPRRAVAQMGRLGAAAAGATIGGALASALLLPFFALRVAIDLWQGQLLRADTPLAFAASTIALAVMAIGPLAALAPATLGLTRRRWLSLFAWLPALPLYYLAITLAGWLALYEACARPFHWAKTEHGVSARRARMAAPAN
ncbi:MAG: glycosyltransferase [Methylobacteriaceae bacterium]|nr:glycosyltransferase [Methylobacteriaceae bacterium]